MNPIQVALMMALINTAIEKAFAVFTKQTGKAVTDEELLALTNNEQARHELIMKEYESYGTDPGVS